MAPFHEYLAAGHAWLLPAAILLGALHGLEPGHSKTMMAAFIISIRGTVGQALLLGLSATISHTGVIWILALVGLRYSGAFNAESLEPYFQAGIGLIVIALGASMFLRSRNARSPREHSHEHGQPGGTIVEDAHEQAHAVEIEERFANRQATTGQIVLFGLTGGLLPCPAAFAVLLVCLQVKRFALGFALVMAFSLGLAITLMTVGAIAALSVRHVTQHFKGFGNLARMAPCLSAGVMVAVGTFVLVHGARILLR